MRLPFLRPKPEAETVSAATQRAARPRGLTAAGGDAVVDAARVRARRRLVGALVLLAVGVGGFPVLFETRPRPLPLDTPFETAARGAGEVAATAPSRKPQVTPLPVDAGDERAAQAALVPAPAAAVEAAAAASTPAPAGAAPNAAPAASRGGNVAAAKAAATTVVAAPAPLAARAAAAASSPPAPARAATAGTPASLVVAAPRSGASASRVDDGARAAALLAGAAAPSAASSATAATAAGGGRYVVQVGAYTDAATLREARAKVEKLGLKTYTQVIENDAGKRTRVRLGPFSTRQEAEAAAAQVKRTGLPANVIVL